MFNRRTTLALAATVLTAGSLSDRFGRRRALLAGLGLFTVASAVCATSQSIAALDAARALQGIGAAAMFATILADAFEEPAARSCAFAAYGATIGGCFALGPVVGGALTSGLGWRSVFYLNLPLGILCAALTISGVRESRDLRARAASTFTGRRRCAPACSCWSWPWCVAIPTAGPPRA